MCLYVWGTTCEGQKITQGNQVSLSRMYIYLPGSIAGPYYLYNVRADIFLGIYVLLGTA